MTFDDTTADDSPRLSVLVVEDHEDTARSTADLLNLAGHAVEVARTAAEALAAGPADVVLLDIHLPDLSGWGMARRLRARAGGAPVFIVAVTGSGRDGDHRRSLEAGADVHLEKPVDPAALLALLGRVRAYLAPAAAGVAS